MDDFYVWRVQAEYHDGSGSDVVATFRLETAARDLLDILLVFGDTSRRFTLVEELVRGNHAAA